MKLLARLTLAGALLAAAVPARAGEVKVSFSNGLVTIVATDASPRQILAEWAKLGQVRVTNLDRLSGGPVTLQLTNVPEAQALETLLRGTAGYVAAPRLDTTLASNASRYDRILLMPGAAPAVPVVTPGSPTQSGGPARGRPQGYPNFDPANTSGDDEADATRMMPGPNGMGRDARPGRPTPADQPQAMMPGAINRQAPSGFPGMPTQGGSAAPPSYDAAATAQRQSGSSVPGMPTAPAQLPLTPYSNAGPPGLSAPTVTSSQVPGQMTPLPAQQMAQPGGYTQTSGAPTARPGQTTGPTPTQFQNPYGLPEPVQPPVVNPSANPYGLPNPVKTPATTPAVTPGSTTPPGPIKNPGEKG